MIKWTAVVEIILMIQVHLQCQEDELNVLNLRKFEDIFFTYTNRKNIFLLYSILNAERNSVII